MNQGTTFSFSLPAGTNVVASPPNPRLGLLEPRYLDQSAARTVLVVGQDPDAVRIFQRYLEGFRVRMASSADEVYGIGRKSVVNAVVIANATSDDVARAVRDRFRGVPTLRCSLHTVARASSQLGVAAFLTKPVSAGQLRQTLRRLSLKPRQALVVEDDPDMARLLYRMIHLIAPPCRVQTTTSAEDALALARADGREPPDLVLLDLLLPEMDGHSFISTWNGDAALQRTPIVVVSAATEEDHDFIVAESVEIRRADGLSVAELLGVVRGSLDWLLPSAHAPTLSVADDGRRWQNVEEAAPEG
jgi:CheY-like chemotaxis protein